MASERVTEAMRRIVAARAQNYCEYCRCSGDFATESFTVEHIKPRQVGGENTLENLAWSCFGCNSHKHTKTYSIDPITKQPEALFNPRQQFWNEHFSWSSDKSEVIGKTPCG
ncbi:MAG: HNH endonuclease signature motif containing protein [Rhizonema sp. PD37]|nr:HNH endonuclease signature motif containing protein [Rhizonema sp. PD37]